MFEATLLCNLCMKTSNTIGETFSMLVNTFDIFEDFVT